MHSLSLQQRIEIGTRAARETLVRQDKIWSRHSDDKVDVAHVLADTVRALLRGTPGDRPLAALSLGSSTEPQFRILESMFRDRLWLVDIEQAAIDALAERSERQCIDHVRPILGDFRQLFGTESAARSFVWNRMGGRSAELITLHHSLYYAPRTEWLSLFGALYQHVLTARGGEPSAVCAAIHAVLGASRSDDRSSVTWLYNHFAAKFFGARNDQDLEAFGAQLTSDSRFHDAAVQTRTSTVRFWCDDFEQFMRVIWMLLLHPGVHRFSEPQQREVTEHVYEHYFLPRLPLKQVQHHLIVQRVCGLGDGRVHNNGERVATHHTRRASCSAEHSGT